jgi:tetratricopeptide (TPR) repeat protein
MPDTVSPPVATSAEQRRIAAQQFERARQAATTSNFDYAINLLQTCCKLDAGNLVYRQTLRKIAKLKYKNNLRGSLFAWLTTARARRRLRAAARGGNYLQALEHGETVLAKNPWQVGAQLLMAEAAETIGLTDTAVWLLEHARTADPRNAKVNRLLARLYERLGNFKAAIAMWDLVAQTNPLDDEASHKAKDLAATQTIVQGKYETKAAAATGSAATAPAAKAETEPEIAALSRSGSHAVSAADPLAKQEAALRAKIETDPSLPGPYMRLAELLQRHEQLDKAKQVLKDAIEATGRHFDIEMALAQLEVEPFRHNLQIAEQRLHKEPANAELKAMRDKLRKEINTREMDIYRKRADRYPTDGAARLELGVRLVRAGIFDEAIQELQHVRKDPKFKVRALMHLGHCFKAKKNAALAKRNFNEALESLSVGEDDLRKDILFELAQLAAADKDWETALQLGNELANQDFGYRGIGKLLEQWEAARGSA